MTVFLLLRERVPADEVSRIQVYEPSQPELIRRTFKPGLRVQLRCEITTGNDESAIKAASMQNTQAVAWKFHFHRRLE